MLAAIAHDRRRQPAGCAHLAGFERLPTRYGSREVVAKGFVDEVVILAGSTEIERHRRSYEKAALVRPAALPGTDQAEARRPRSGGVDCEAAARGTTDLRVAEGGARLRRWLDGGEGLNSRAEDLVARDDLAASIQSDLRCAPASPNAGHQQPDSNLIPGIAIRGRPWRPGATGKFLTPITHTATILRSLLRCAYRIATFARDKKALGPQSARDGFLVRASRGRTHAQVPSDPQRKEGCRPPFARDGTRRQISARTDRKSQRSINSPVAYIGQNPLMAST